MKYLKTQEGFFDFFKKKRKHSDGIYYWTDDEIKELNYIGFESSFVISTISPLYYTPENSETIKEIVIEKQSDVDYDTHQEDWFYQIIITHKNDKEEFKDFGNFYDLKKYLLSIIPNEEITSRKYNL